MSGVYTHTCVGLSQDTMYQVSVAAVNGAGEGERESVLGRTVCEGLTPNVRTVTGDIRVSVTSACLDQ